MGMQAAVIEFARNVAGLEGAGSGEFDEACPRKVIDFMPGKAPSSRRAARCASARTRASSLPTACSSVATEFAR